MKIAACDDDLIFLQELSNYLDQYNEINNKDIEYQIFSNPLELIAQLEKGINYDAILLDIFMPGINGIECARDIRIYDNFVKIVYLTSSPDFAIESYTVRAYYYLLKPLEKDKLFMVLNQLEEEADATRNDIFVFKSKTGIVKLSLSKLEYCEMINRKVILYTSDGREYECGLKMNELEEKLTPFEMFIRPHRSFLVNMDYINELTSHNIIMECGESIPVPKEKYTQIKNIYMEYIFSSEPSVVMSGVDKFSQRSKD